jgi:hypothetical protein
MFACQVTSLVGQLVDLVLKFLDVVHNNLIFAVERRSHGFGFMIEILSVLYSIPSKRGLNFRNSIS